MTTVVQTDYRPQIRPALPGMVVDQVPFTIETYQVEAAGGIGFGLAITRGVADWGANVGGTKFLGCSVKDVSIYQAPLDPLATTFNFVPDTWPYRSNMGVCTRGHIWVQAMAVVAAGDALFYDANGGWTNSASGDAAAGSIAFGQNPSDGQTIAIAGT